MRAITRLVSITGTLALLLTPRLALAHCPLCTAGAGALAVGAAWLGISTGVVGILIGAFAYALSVWTARLIKQRYIPYQSPIIGVTVFLATVVPIAPLIYEPIPVYLSLVGKYGTFLHNTYALNLFLVGVVIGTLLVYAAPVISKKLTALREHQLPYQGLSITFGLLLVVSAIIELAL